MSIVEIIRSMSALGGIVIILILSDAVKKRMKARLWG